jgi:hypothetical protein
MMLEAEWRICSSDISLQAADMPCSNSVTFKIDFNFAAAAIASTGCDTTSSFFGIGKKTVLKTLKDNIDEFADLNKLCLFDSETSIDVSRYFVARL